MERRVPLLPLPRALFPVTYQLARYPRRALAALLDLLLLGSLLVEGWLLVASAAGLEVSLQEATGTTLQWEAAIGGEILLIGVLGLAWAWLAARLGGATPGKAALGLRVVGEDGAPAAMREAFVREILVKVVLQGGLSALTLGVAAVVNHALPLWDREHRTGHDRLLRTRVVDVRRP